MTAHWLKIKCREGVKVSEQHAVMVKYLSLLQVVMVLCVWSLIVGELSGSSGHLKPLNVTRLLLLCAVSERETKTPEILGGGFSCLFNEDGGNKKHAGGTRFHL